MKTLLFFIFLLLSTLLSSQTWTNYNLKELNLYSTGLYDLDIDSKDNIWFASLSGLLKYDGIEWTVFDTLNSELPQNNLFSVEIDKEDNVWIGYGSIGPSRGLAIFNGQNWRIYNKNNSAYSLNTIRDITFDKNEIPWLATLSYLWRFQNGEWTQIKHNSKEENSVYAYVNEVEVDKNNDIWFTTSYDGIVHYSNGRLNRYWIDDPYSYDGLAIDSNNNIWVFNNDSLMHFEVANRQWEVIETEITHPSNSASPVHTIIVDRYNTLWVAERRNFHNFNPVSEIWKTYTAPDSLYDPSSGGDSFKDFKLDANGNFWFITSGDGAFKLSDVITDVEDEQIVKNISIYPNPTSTLLSYETNNITSIIQQSIVDLSGKEVINDKIANALRNSIDVSKLQIGIYFLQLTDTKGVKYSKKFVVE